MEGAGIGAAPVLQLSLLRVNRGRVMTMDDAEASAQRPAVFAMEAEMALCAPKRSTGGSRLWWIRP